MQILPVIHHFDRDTTIEQAALTFEAGAHGVFLISHHGADHDLIDIGVDIKNKHPGKLVGLNLLVYDIMSAARAVADAGLDMLWGDKCGVSSLGLNDVGNQLCEFARTNPGIKVFASVAFKYQPHEPDPGLACVHALSSGFIPTTSGSGTGVAAPLEKIVSMSVSSAGKLAIASGMTVENVASYAPYLSHILVATGVTYDEHHFDFPVLCRFIAVACRLKAWDWLEHGNVQRVRTDLPISSIHQLLAMDKP